jgi:hypothetical protein
VIAMLAEMAHSQFVHQKTGWIKNSLLSGYLPDKVQVLLLPGFSKGFFFSWL